MLRWGSKRRSWVRRIFDVLWVSWMGAAFAQKLAGVKIALIFPTFTDVELASYADNARLLGAIPHLGLGYVASELIRYGADVILLDCMTLGMSVQEAIEKTREFGADYAGFSLTTVDWACSLIWMKAFKAALDIQILVGGVHMDCYPTETLSHSCIDLGYIGYADLGLVTLLEAHLAQAPLDEIPGAVYRREDGSVQVNANDTKSREADSMAIPARHLMPYQSHFSIVSTRKYFTAAMSNFGCPFGCEFCILANNTVRWRSAKSVVDEMELCHYDFGIREMDFFDPVFSLRKERLLAICDEIRRRGLHRKMIWSVRARTDVMDDIALDAMWQAGCRRIFYGIESGSQAILERIGKVQKTTEDMAKTIIKTKRRGFETLAFVMIGNPLETPETVRMTRDMLMDLPIDFVQISHLFPLPNTPLYNDIVAQTGVDTWRNHILEGAPSKPYALLDTALTSEDIEKMVTQLYTDFYFRPRFAKLALKRLRYPEVIKRGMVAAYSISSNRAKDVIRRGRANFAL